MLQLIRREVTKTTKDILMGAPPFNPNFDGNALAWYDGDVGLSVASWLDQSGNGYTLTNTNNPTVISPAINGHDALLFNGTTQQAANTTIPTNVPTSVYFVLKVVSWVNGRRISQSTTATANLLWFAGASPNIQAFNNLTIDTSPNLAVGSYGIITVVWNGATSELRTGDNVAVAGDTGAGTGMGFTLANNNGGGSHANIEVAYVIVRTGADSTAKQDKIINWLKSHFAL